MQETEEEDKEIEKVDESSGTITDPFDPNKIKIYTQQMTLGDIIDRLENDEINLSPDFQRRADLWTPKQQSLLIESILLKLPIPSFYFDGADDNKWQVVDGLQRISTIKNFVIKDKDGNTDALRLEGLELLAYNGYTFRKLPREFQRRIKTFPITVSVIEKESPAEAKYNIFSRLNKGGLVLKPQEIRNALNQGIPSDLVKTLAGLEEFKTATDYKIKNSQSPNYRMEDCDFITRFIAFYVTDYRNYKPEPDLDAFLNKAMASLKKISEAERNMLFTDFRCAMQTAYQIFGKDAFRKRQNKEDARKPINKALFEAISVNLARLTEDQRKVLIERKEIFKDKFIVAMNQKDEIKNTIAPLMAAISGGTGQRETVLARFSIIENIIKEILEND